MSKKKIKLPFKLTYDAPVTLSFAILSLIFFVVDFYIVKQKLGTLLLSSPTTPKGTLPFDIKNALSYLRMIFYIFGVSNPIAFISNLIFILLLGPSIEEKYGSVVIGIMMVVASLFSGVLNACFRTVSMQGATAIVFMMIFLNAFMSFTKKKVPLSFVVVFALYIIIQIVDNKVNGVVGLFINIAGGLCGSLFAFLASPKTKAVKKANGLKAKAEVYADADDENSPRFQKKNDEESDETVVGSLKF